MPDEDSRYAEFVVQDDGHDLPGGTVGGETASAGLDLALLRLLATQLGGSFAIGSPDGDAGGTIARLRFPR